MSSNGLIFGGLKSLHATSQNPALLHAILLNVNSPLFNNNNHNKKLYFKRVTQFTHSDVSYRLNREGTTLCFNNRLFYSVL